MSNGNFIIDISPVDVNNIPILYYSWFESDYISSTIMGILSVPLLLIAKIITTLGIYLVNLYADPSTLLAPFAWFIDSILGQVFKIVSLPILLSLAISIFIAREMLSLSAADADNAKGGTRRFNVKAKADPLAFMQGGDGPLRLGESSIKAVTNGFVHIVLSTLIIFAVLGNPIGMLEKLTTFVQETAQSVFPNGAIGSEETLTLGQFVSQILALMIIPMNFSRYDTSPQCLADWGNANIGGAANKNTPHGGIAQVLDPDLLNPACFSDREPYLTIVGGVFIIVAMLAISAFFIVMFSRAALFAWNMIVIGFRLVLEIFRGLFLSTEENKTVKAKVDSLWDSVWDFGVFLAYYLLVLLLTYAIPMGVLAAMRAIELNEFIAIIATTVAMAVISWFMWGFSPPAKFLRNPGSYQLSWESIGRGAMNLAKGEIHDGDKITRLRNDDGTFAVKEFIMATSLGGNIATFQNDMKNVREKALRGVMGSRYDEYEANKEKIKEKTKRFLKIEDRKMSDKSGMRRIQREIRLANLTSRKEATEQQIARLGTDMSPKAVAKREKLEAKLEALNTKIDATKKSSEALAAGTALRNAPHLIRVEEGLDLYKKQYLKKLIAENKKLSPEDKKDAEALEKEASAYIKEHKAAIEKILEEQQTSIASYSGNSLGFISSLDDLTQYELKVEKAKKNNESKKPAQEKEDREEISNSSSTITGAKSEDRSATPKQKEENRKARTAAEKNLKEKGASDEDIKALGELGEFKDSIREAIAALKQPSMLMSTDEEVKNYTYSIVGGIADKLKDADKENLGAIRNDWDKVNSIIENLAQSSNREETLNTLANGLHRISLESVSILQQEREDKIAAESAAMRKTIENIFNKDRTFEMLKNIENMPAGDRATAEAAIRKGEISNNGVPQTPRSLQYTLKESGATNILDPRGEGNPAGGFSNGTSKNSAMGEVKSNPQRKDVQVLTSELTSPSRQNIAATEQEIYRYAEENKGKILVNLKG